jgi:hypothetical protein
MDKGFLAHPKWAKRFSKALISSVFGHFFEPCLNFHCFLFKKKFFCILKNLLAHFGCAKKPFCSFQIDRFFPFIANELKFLVTNSLRIMEDVNQISPTSSLLFSLPQLLRHLNSLDNGTKMGKNS